MREMTCEKARRMLALGQPGEAVSGHLARCQACRIEAARLETVLRELHKGADLEPPAPLDGLVRAALRAGAGTSRILLRPVVAMGLAVAGLVALISALSIALAQTSLGEQAPLLAVALVIGYLAVSSTAVLPVLLHPAVRGSLRVREVKR